MLRSDVVVQTGKPSQFWQSTNQAQADINLYYGGRVIHSIKNKGNAFGLNKGSTNIQFCCKIWTRQCLGNYSKSSAFYASLFLQLYSQYYGQILKRPHYPYVTKRVFNLKFLQGVLVVDLVVEVAIRHSWCQMPNGFPELDGYQSRK